MSRPRVVRAQGRRAVGNSEPWPRIEGRNELRGSGRLWRRPDVKEEKILRIDRLADPLGLLSRAGRTQALGPHQQAVEIVMNDLSHP